MRTTFKHEDFLDFYYDGKWASELGLIKVNNGKRQDDEVLPASKDTTIDIPGNDGVYYVNSKYQQREFKIDFAYDGLSEDDIKGIREWLAPQKECRLIFSEHPYKYYMAKPKSAPKLSYIAFDASDGSRVYKGEGSVQFVCYYPWARSVATKKDDLEAFFNKGHENNNSDVKYYTVTDQQLIGSNIADNNKAVTLSSDNNGFIINNCGQLPSPFKLYFDVLGHYAETSKYYKFYIDNSKEIMVLDANQLVQGGLGPGSYCIDTENHLIMRCKKIVSDNNNTTYVIEESNGNAVILNKAIVAGDFFSLPVGTGTKLIIDSGEDSFNYDAKHFLYDWLYY